MTHNHKIAALRRDYSHSELLETDVDLDPIKQFRTWFDQAMDSLVTEPNAMCLSTVCNNRPDSRIVLLKGIHDDGFVFFTNYHSSKGQEIAENHFVSLNFAWLEIERQVRIQGIAKKVSAEESDAYFYSRPHESQVGAIVSAQSQHLKSREELEKAMTEALSRYEREKPVRPEHWGGYIVQPDMLEFWQGRVSRLHDRLRYELVDGQWVLSRLYP